MEGKLRAFLAGAAKRENVRVAISERFVDEAGQPQLWELAPLCAADVQRLLAEPGRETGKPGRLLLQLLAESVVWPDLQEAELQDSWGALGAEQLLLRMLSPGEFAALQRAFVELNLQGRGLGEQVAQAKN
ncbi:MAG: phage portal protein [Peptococcaceae bacterium]|nr:phage portal protein [Peptococcaceae bacterium]